MNASATTNEPRWKEVYLTLESEIRSTLSSGDRFFTIEQLNERFSVSSITSRRVLDELSRTKLIRKVHGKGCFVRMHKLEQPVCLIVSDDKPLDVFWRVSEKQIEVTGGILEEVSRLHSSVEAVSWRDFAAGKLPRRSYVLISDFWVELEDIRRIVERDQHTCLYYEAPIPFEGISCTVPDYRGGARQAIQHLVDLGHRRIAFLNGLVSHPSFMPRHVGYMESLLQSGIMYDPGIVRETEDDNPGEDLRALAEIFAAPRRPTAVFVASHSRATNTLSFLRERGLRVPEDVSVVCYDNVLSTASATPPLTVLDFHWRWNGANAVRIMQKMLEERSAGPVVETQPVDLIVRGSTGPCRQG